MREKRGARDDVRMWAGLELETDEKGLRDEANDEHDPAPEPWGV
jgi:hypothetical protein